LAHLEENLRSLTGTVTRVRQTLNENSGVSSQSNNAVSW
jgi:phosphotransferase system IIB component